MSENPLTSGEGTLPDDTDHYTLHAVRLACCGLVMKIGCRTAGGAGFTIEQIPKTLAYGHNSTSYWFEERSQRHRCELVSETNPLGLAPREAPNNE